MILITEICSRVNIVGRLGSQNGFSCQESHVGFSLSQTPTLSACRMRAHHCFNFWVYTSGSQSTVLGTTAAAPGDFMCVCVCVWCVWCRVQLFLTPWTICSPPGSSVHGILQARILEWVAISSSRGSFWPRNGTRVSCVSFRRVLYPWATREAPGDFIAMQIL